MTKVTIVKNYLTDKVPRVCFASVMENRNRQKVRKAYTGLVLLEVNNLTSPTSKYSLKKSGLYLVSPDFFYIFAPNN